jgi:quercetin dioxygenase-like cupin family protein
MTIEAEVFSPATPTPFVTHAEDTEPRWYTGALVSFLAIGEQTGERLAVFRAAARAGEEIPEHMHEREDEALYVLSGELSGAAGDQPFQAGAGDFVFLPRRVPHTWRAESDVDLLVLLTPAGFERPFIEFSEPAPECALPPPGLPDETLLMRLMERENELGVFYTLQQYHQ